MEQSRDQIRFSYRGASPASGKPHRLLSSFEIADARKSYLIMEIRSHVFEIGDLRSRPDERRLVRASAANELELGKKYFTIEPESFIGFQNEMETKLEETEKSIKTMSNEQ